MQTTLNKIFECTGIGLHSGKPTRIVLRPARVNTGVLFRSIQASQVVPLFPSPFSVVATGLATTLGNAKAQIATVEHLLGALHGLEVDNVLVDVYGSEIPILDGSAASFVQRIQAVGLCRQKEPRRLFRMKRRLEFEDAGRRVVAEPYNGLRIDYRIDFAHQDIGKQRFVFEAHPDAFVRLIARARTFGFLEEVTYLQQQGLACGGSLENAVVFDASGVMNPEGLRFVDEMVRHKILDFLGDIAVVPYRLWGAFTVERSGHEVNNKFMRFLEKHREEYLEPVWNGGAPQRFYPETASSAFPVPCPAWA